MDEMMCNFKRCRKRLGSFAWVTSCSHIFCDEDGTREFNKCFACPACETNLSGKFDIVRIDLSPSEQYKSMVLAGHKPDTILEVCTRAVAFWTYQIQQERIYQDYVANKSKERTTQLEQYFEQTVNKLQSENMLLKSQIAGIKKELESSKKKSHDLSDRLAERIRQYQKLQIMYETLRRRSINVNMLDPGVQHEGFSRAHHMLANNYDLHIPLSSGDESSGIPFGHRCASNRKRATSPPEKEFVLRPANTPIQGDTDAASVQNRFSLELGTPNDVVRRLGHRMT